MTLNSAKAYEVWIGCAKVPLASIDQLDSWENARMGVTGANLNLVGFNHRDVDNPITENEESMDGANKKQKISNWSTFFNELNPPARFGMSPLARSSFHSDEGPSRDGTLIEALEGEFRGEEFGYKIGSLMPYASQLGEDRSLPPVAFTTEELAEMRAWLDDRPGGDEVEIMDNVRLFNRRAFMDDLEARGQYIDSYVFEAAPEKFYEDRGNRQAMLDAFINEPELRDKKIVFQIPMSHWEIEGEDGATNYQSTRNFIVWLGNKYGRDFLKSDRVKFLIMTYDSPVRFYPEMNRAQDRYVNSITGIIWSLIEQEALFAGRLRNPNGTERVPTRADAFSYRRKSLVTTLYNDGNVEELIIYSVENDRGNFVLNKETEWKVYSTNGWLIKEGNGKDIDLHYVPPGVYVIVTTNERQKVLIN